jgi:hypothetical protein
LTRAFPPNSLQPDDEPNLVAEDDAGVGEAQTVETCTDPAPALVCGDPDPWSGSGEQWNATYEGPIPGTIGGRGRFIPQGSAESMTGALELTAEIDFCGAGVLGEDEIPPWYEDQRCTVDTDEYLAHACNCEDPSAGSPTTTAVSDEELELRTMDLTERCGDAVDRSATECIDGDQLVLTGTIVTEAVLDSLEGRTLEKCRALRDALEEEDAVPIGFEIRRAFSDRLVLRTRLAHRIHRNLDGVETFADVEPCLDRGLLAFDVRALNQFAVSGSQSGFQHRVRANAAGRCVVDADADPLLQGRARFGCTYRSRGIEFRMHDPRGPRELSPRPGTALVAGVGSPATKLRVNVASAGFGSVNVVAVQLRYNEVDGHLYLVDVHRRGLVPIQLDPLLGFVSFSFN